MNNQTSKFVGRKSILSAVIMSTIFMTSCATTPESPQGAMEARDKLDALQNNPELADLARVEVRDAEAAVSAAEKPLAESEAELARHRVFMADQKVEIAVAKATTRALESQREQLGEQRDAARLQARTDEVTRARSDASQARQSQAASAAETAELQRQVANLEAEATDRGLVLTLGDVLFATGSAELQRGANTNLDKLVSFLSQYPERTVLIEGHTDNVGSASFNQDLSQRRADSVRRYLMQQDIASHRMRASGIGQERPVSNNETPTGRQQNRRVEIVIEHVPASAARPSR